MNEQQENKPKSSVPANERFQHKMPVSGVVVFVKPVEEQCEYRRSKKWASTSFAKCGPRYMRLSVLVRTDEGWTLAGKIGKALDNASVPDVRVGDHIQVDPIQLDRSWLTNEQRSKGIYTSNLLHRTITGKVIRRRA